MERVMRNFYDLRKLKNVLVRNLLYENILDSRNLKFLRNLQTLINQELKAEEREILAQK